MVINPWSTAYVRPKSIDGRTNNLETLHKSDSAGPITRPYRHPVGRLNRLDEIISKV